MSLPRDAHHPYAVDDRLVMPESRHEVIDGQVVYVSPADQEHASRHSKISALLEASVAEGYDVASDMLTRTSQFDDMAPDASVYPSAADPVTGGRQIEELAFEVASTERLGACGRKAARLTGRGVRRVFAVDVAQRRALEWRTDLGEWEILPHDGSIEDPVLAAPVSVHDLVEAGKADDGVARALLTKGNVVLKAALEARFSDGRSYGKAEALLAVLGARGLALSEADVARLRGATDSEAIDEWLVRAATARSAADVFKGG